MVAWWDDISILEPGYGYHPKTWLVTMAEYDIGAVDIFAGTGVKITTDWKTLHTLGVLLLLFSAFVFSIIKKWWWQ